jgi:SPOR domain/WD40-like Beta Propeller Repeat
MYRLLFTFFMCSASLPAQTVSELLKTAYKLEQASHLYDAAVLQEKAWRIKPQDKGLAWNAGQNYYYAKDYRKAIDCLIALRMDGDSYPLAGLMYARSLKADSRYREAMEAYTQFLTGYKASDKKVLEEIVVTEMRGCDYALQLNEAAKTKPKNTNLKFELLPEGVNSLENEFAPIPITDDLLYFSSNFQGSAKIYRIMRQDGVWSRPELAQGLPKPVEEHFGNGCFSPDGSRFYFTQCGGAAKKDKEGRALCNIYVTLREGGGEWSEPLKLRDYVNAPNATNTQPYVFESNGEEVLIFASNREGGKGGLDLYHCTRPLTSNDLDFSLPVSMGDFVNTVGDELSPFVDPLTSSLYFSSNGHLSLGGFDVYKVPYMTSGAEVENIGLPYNSATDDYGYILKKSGDGGFMVSNRQKLPQKLSTRHDDLFEFTTTKQSNYLVATVFDATHKVSLRDVEATLYEKAKDGRLRLLTAQKFAEGEIKFPIEVGKTYVLEAVKEGYAMQSAETGKLTETPAGHKLSINLFKKQQPGKAGVQEAAPTPKPVLEAPEPERREPVKAERKKTEPVITDPVVVGASSPNGLFWVQIEASSALPNLDSDTRFDPIRHLGQIKSLGLRSDGLYRVVLGGFATRDEANAAARVVRSESAFKAAFVARN